MKEVKRFLRFSLFSFKGLFGWLEPKIYLMVKVINPVFTLIFFCLLTRYAYKSNDVTPYLVGNAMILVYMSAIFGVGNVLALERYFGTLKVIMIAPTNKFFIFAGRGFFHIVDGLITVIISLGVGSLLFGFHSNGSFLQILLILVISTYSVAGLGMMLASLGLKYRDMNLVMNISSMMILVLTGANFPIEKLPVWLQGISNVLPLTRGIRAAQMTLVGANFTEVGTLLLSEFILGTIFLLLGYVLFSLMDHLAVKDGAFDLY